MVEEVKEWKRKLQPPEIYNLLPKTNCGECGVPKCIAFAFMLISGKKKVEDCPYIAAPEYEDNYDILIKAFGISENVEKMGWFLLDREKCDLCGVCVSACKVSGDDIGEQSVLMFIDSKVMPQEKNFEHCILCRACEKACPNYAIRIDRRAKQEEEKKRGKVSLV